MPQAPTLARSHAQNNEGKVPLKNKGENGNKHNAGHTKLAQNAEREVWEEARGVEAGWPAWEKLAKQRCCALAAGNVKGIATKLSSIAALLVMCHCFTALIPQTANV